jgi:uncharacterized protein YkwD
MWRVRSALIPLVLLVPVSLFAGDDAKEKREDGGFALTKDEQTLLELLNKERDKEKLPPLRPQSLLFKAARGHSANMAKQEKLEHVLDGKTPGQRVLAAGYDYGKVSENIAVSDSDKAPLPMIVKSWMESKTHRDNLLSDKVTETGLGIAKSEKGGVYYTQLFARPRKVIKPRKEP